MMKILRTLSVDFVMRTVSRFVSAYTHDPMILFRMRSLSLILCTVFIVSVVQAVNSFDRSSEAQLAAAALIAAATLSGLIFMRKVRHVDRYAAFNLIAILLLGTVLDVWVGRHSFSPFMAWVPFLVFVMILVSSQHYSRWMTGLAVVYALLVTLSPLTTGFLPRSLGASQDAFIARVSAGIFLVVLMSWIITVFYEHFFRMAADEIEKIQVGVEKQRNNFLMTRFAGSIAADFHELLQCLEDLVKDMSARDDTKPLAALYPVIEKARQYSERMSHLTDRYRLLSIPSQVAILQGIHLSDFLVSIQRFSPGTFYVLHKDLNPDTLLRGEHVFTLQLILCLGLMKAQTLPGQSTICLEIERKEEQLVFIYPFWNDEFFHEIHQLLDDMKGFAIRQGKSLRIHIPISQIC